MAYFIFDKMRMLKLRICFSMFSICTENVFHLLMVYMLQWNVTGFIIASAYTNQKTTSVVNCVTSNECIIACYLCRRQEYVIEHVTVV